MEFIKRNKNRIIPIAIALGLAGITVLIAFLSGHGAYDLENRPYSSLPLALLSIAVFVIYIALCIFLRVKRRRLILKALLIYQIIGLAASVLHFAFLLAGEETGLFGVVISVFYYWSLPYHEGGLLVVSLLHFPVRYVLMLMLGFVTFATGFSYSGIIKDEAFEKKVKEKHDPEDRSSL